MEALTAADPDRIGGYRLLGRLGEGGMGRVYLARSDRGRTVAVKVVQAELARHPDFRQRFAQEINAARRVGGEWTAPVLDADTEAGTPWVATGYVAGPSLQEVVDELHGPLPLSSVTALASGLVRALEAIHRAGLVHRDLKPSNVLITIDGPRIIDFGIAHALHTAAGGGLTRTGAVIGSPGFMSPEQVRGETVTPASDVFCLGSVLAYAATGRTPFGTAASGVHALMFRIAEKEPDLTGLDGTFRDLVAGCLNKNPAARPSVAALLSVSGDSTALTGTWLPAEVLARLGRHAVQLLDSEEPEARVTYQPTQLDGAGTPPAALGTPPGSPRPFGASPYGDPAPYGPTATAPGPYPHFPQAGTPPQQRAPHHQVSGPTPWRAPAHTGAPPARPVQPLRAPANALTTVLGALSVVIAARLVANLLTYSRLEGLEKADWQPLLDSGKLDGYRLATDVTSLLTVVTVLPAVGLWLWWFWRLHVNTGHLAPGMSRYGTGLAIGSWFIPFGNLFLPKQIANDIWQASSPTPTEESPSGRRPVKVLLNFWWASCVVHLSFSYVISWYDWYTRDAPRAARGFISLGIVDGLVALVAGILAILVVRRLTRWQERRLPL